MLFLFKLITLLALLLNSAQAKGPAVHEEFEAAMNKVGSLHFFHQYTFNTGTGNREELVVDSVEEIQGWRGCQGVIEWVKSGEAAPLWVVGRRESSLCIVHFSTHPSAFNFSHTIIELGKSVKGAGVFDHYDRTTNQREVALIVVTALQEVHYITWFRLYSTGYEEVDQWPLFAEVDWVGVSSTDEGYSRLQLLRRQGPLSKPSLDSYALSLGSAGHQFRLVSSEELCRGKEPTCPEQEPATLKARNLVPQLRPYLGSFESWLVIEETGVLASDLTGTFILVWGPSGAQWIPLLPCGPSPGCLEGLNGGVMFHTGDQSLWTLLVSPSRLLRLATRMVPLPNPELFVLELTQARTILEAEWESMRQRLGIEESEARAEAGQSYRDPPDLSALEENLARIGRALEELDRRTDRPTPPRPPTTPHLATSVRGYVEFEEPLEVRPVAGQVLPLELNSERGTIVGQLTLIPEDASRINETMLVPSTLENHGVAKEENEEDKTEEENYAQGNYDGDWGGERKEEGDNFETEGEGESTWGGKQKNGEEGRKGVHPMESGINAELTPHQEVGKEVYAKPGYYGSQGWWPYFYRRPPYSPSLPIVPVPVAVQYPYY